MNQSNPWTQQSQQPQQQPQQAGFAGQQTPPQWSQPPQQVTQQQPGGPAAQPEQLSLFPVAATEPVEQPTVSGQAAPPTQVQPPNLQAAEEQVADGVLKDILVLLKEFSYRENCDRYSADGEKIKLIVDYLWLRQLTPDLAFETFLDLYCQVANFDGTNLIHPADAIKDLLPRSKTQAEKRQVRQWKAGEVVDYVSVYIDMIRGAEAAGVAVPMTFNDFLVNENLREQFFAGAFKSEQKAAKPKQGKAKPKKSGSERPTTAGDRCLMTHQDGRHFRGRTERVWTDGEGEAARVYVDFKSDAGEEFKGVSIMKFEVIDDAPPKTPVVDATNEPKPEAGVKTLTIKKAEYAPAKQCLALSQPVGTVEVGSNVYNWHQHFDDGHTAVICIVNGEDKPYVDAFLCKDSPQNVIAEIPPREGLAGTYQFDAPHGVYTLEVKGNE